MISAAILSAGCCDDDIKPAVFCESDLLTGIPDAVQVVGTTQLTRNTDGLQLTLDVDGLIPGHAYSVWWVVWNNPEFCDGACDDPDVGSEDVKVEVLYAAGSVAGGTKGNFGATLKEDDVTGSINGEFFNLPNNGGLLDAMKAEIHVVLRSHGPAIPGQVDQQISTYAGGCNPSDPNYNGGHGFIPFFTTTPESEGECSSLFVSVFPGDCK
jgi:hypothetical protein